MTHDGVSEVLLYSVDADGDVGACLVVTVRTLRLPARTRGSGSLSAVVVACDCSVHFQAG